MGNYLEPQQSRRGSGNNHGDILSFYMKEATPAAATSLVLGPGQAPSMYKHAMFGWQCAVRHGKSSRVVRLPVANTASTFRS